MQPILLSSDRLRGTCTSCSAVVVDLELENHRIDEGTDDMPVDEGKQTGQVWGLLSVVYSASMGACCQNVLFPPRSHHLQMDSVCLSRRHTE